MKATWDTQLHSNPAGYPTYKSPEKTPRDDQVIIAQKLGEEDKDRDQVIRAGDNLYRWRYETTDQLFCKVTDLYVWRGCGGFDF